MGIVRPRPVLVATVLLLYGELGCQVLAGLGDALPSGSTIDGSLVVEGGGLTGGPTQGDGSNPGRDGAPPPSDAGAVADSTSGADGPSTTQDSGPGGTKDATVAAPLATGDLRLAFASASGTVSYRTWSRASGLWSNALSLATYANASVSWIEPAIAQSSQAEAVGAWWTSAASGTVSLALPERSAGWASAVDTTGVSTAQEAHRGFDVAYETVSGDALAVYTVGTSNPKFRAKAGGAWSSEQSVFSSPPGAASVDWVLLAPHPSIDEIALVYSDTAQHLFAAVWNGSAWTAASTTTLDTSGLNVSDFPAFTAAYGNSTGDLIVAWGHPSTCGGAADPLYYSTKPNGSSAFSAPATAGAIGPPGIITAASEPGTARVAFGVVEYCAGCASSGCDDFSVATWSGTAFDSVIDLDGTVGVRYTIRPGSIPVSVGWRGTSGEAVVVYTHPGGTLSWASWTSAAGWTLETPAAMSPALATQAGFQMLRVPSAMAGGQDDLALLVEDTNGSLWAKLFDGSTWTDMNAGAPLGTGLWVSSGRPFGAVVGP